MASWSELIQWQTIPMIENVSMSWGKMDLSQCFIYIYVCCCQVTIRMLSRPGYAYLYLYGTSDYALGPQYKHWNEIQKGSDLLKYLT